MYTGELIKGPPTAPRPSKNNNNRNTMVRGRISQGLCDEEDVEGCGDVVRRMLEVVCVWKKVLCVQQ